MTERMPFEFTQTSLSGLDALLRHPGPHRDKTWALVTNDAAHAIDGQSGRVALLKAGFRIKRLFSPEHGISVQGADGEQQPDRIDPMTGLPVTSLYGRQWAPTTEELREVDAVLFDIPDIGCRFYTYLWTMTHVMEACAANGKPLFIADRRNPIGTLLEKSEGPWLDEEHCASFIGRWNIPLKHACTLGELARYFAATRVRDLDLHVIPVPAYLRGPASLKDPFVPTSPAIQDLQTALLYPGTCLLEGVHLNEGRGTAHPFSGFGSPWLDTDALLRHIQTLPNTGWVADKLNFKAVTGPYTGEMCSGIRLRVVEPEALLALRMGLEILRGICLIHPGQLVERAYPTHANPTGMGHLDRLLGIKDSFQLLLHDGSLQTDVAETWRSMMEDHLLYA